MEEGFGKKGWKKYFPHILNCHIRKRVGIKAERLEGREGGMLILGKEKVLDFNLESRETERRGTPRKGKQVSRPQLRKDGKKQRGRKKVKVI